MPHGDRFDDVMLAFVNQDAYDKFRLSKEDYELQKELEKEQEKAKAEAEKKQDKKKKDDGKKDEAKKEETKRHCGRTSTASKTASCV